MYTKIFLEYRAVYDTMCKYVVQPEGPQMAIKCSARTLHNGYLWQEYRNTLRICNTVLNAFPQQKCVHERASRLLYAYIACLDFL